jgi:hypothetical protein
MKRILSALKVKNSVPGQKGLAYSAELLARSSGEDGCKKNPHFCRNRAEMGPISTTRLLDSFGDGDDPAFGIFESKFAHAIELIFDRHNDFRSRFLNGGHDFLDALDFDELSQAASDWPGAEWGIVFRNSFLIVEEDFDTAV